MIIRYDRHLDSQPTTGNTNAQFCAAHTRDLWHLAAALVVQKTGPHQRDHGLPLYGNLFIIWLAVCFGLGRQFGVVASPDLAGYDTLLALSGILSLACGVMYIVWAFKARASLRHYALNTFRFDLKMNAFYTVLFNVFYITYCINDMPQALAKHRIIRGQAPVPPESPSPQ
ncbi:hypothetical protein EEAAV_09560 [Rahnella aceris]